MRRRSGKAAADEERGVVPVSETVDQELVEAFVGASVALVGLAARSVASVDGDLTLPQYRALVVLATQGPQRAADLATALDVSPSTATRMCDRLVRKGLITRHRPEEDRRSLDISITPEGKSLVRRIMRRRRRELEQILQVMPARGRSTLVRGLRAFADATGQVPEQHWSLGWE